MPTTEKQSKKLWQGLFMRSGHQYEEWCRATSEAEAFVLLCARVSIEMGTTSYSVRNWFQGKPNSYTIKEVTE